MRTGAWCRSKGWRLRSRWSRWIVEGRAKRWYTGSGIPVGSGTQASSAVLEKLADDPALVRQMEKAGRVHVQRYEWTRFCTTLDEYLDGLSSAEPAVDASDRRGEVLASS